MTGTGGKAPPGKALAAEAVHKPWDRARVKQGSNSHLWGRVCGHCKCFVVRSGLKVENAKYVINGLIIYKQPREMLSGHRGLDKLGRHSRHMSSWIQLLESTANQLPVSMPSTPQAAENEWRTLRTTRNGRQGLVNTSYAGHGQETRGNTPRVASGRWTAEGMPERIRGGAERG